MSTPKAGVSASSAGSPSVDFPERRSTFDVTFVADSSVAPGPVDFSLSYAGLSLTMSQAVQVYDATPVVTGVIQNPPSSPGGSFTVQITGSNFGLARSVMVCALLTDPASFTRLMTDQREKLRLLPSGDRVGPGNIEAMIRAAQKWDTKLVLLAFSGTDAGIAPHAGSTIGHLPRELRPAASASRVLQSAAS